MKNKSSAEYATFLFVHKYFADKNPLFSIDEPSLGLAPNLVVSLFHTIKSLNDEGLTTLIVEQHVPQVLQIADRAYVLENGSLVLGEAAEEVFNNERAKVAHLGL
ncbi:MAG: hypothetical protein OEW82_02615 [Dehalococcoidia bacterium]|nr:hypothetical protein [Dehalococcoidia bacterium]